MFHEMVFIQRHSVSQLGDWHDDLIVIVCWTLGPGLLHCVLGQDTYIFIVPLPGHQSVGINEFNAVSNLAIDKHPNRRKENYTPGHFMPRKQGYSSGLMGSKPKHRLDPFTSS